MSMKLENHRTSKVAGCNFLEIIRIFPKLGKKGPKLIQKYVFVELWENFVIILCWKYLKWKVFYDSLFPCANPMPSKFWFTLYRSKCCCWIRLQDCLIINMLLVVILEFFAWRKSLQRGCSWKYYFCLCVIRCVQLYSNLRRLARVLLVGLGGMTTFKVVQNEELINLWKTIVLSPEFNTHNFKLLNKIWSCPVKLQDSLIIDTCRRISWCLTFLA